MNIKIVLIITGFFILSGSCVRYNEEDTERIYTKSIERIFSGDFEKSLIDSAEYYYPLRDEVVEAASVYIVDIPQEGYWYYNRFDGINIPYALTIDAVDYYSEIIDELNRNKESNFLISAELEYTASISFKEKYTSPAINSMGNPIVPENFESVYVVHCTLSWNQYCGSLCAMWVDKERIAVFDEDGNLLKVYLDGPISVPVS